jgi:hypothetical protein
VRSPLKRRPLHNPGQSLDEQIQDLVVGPIFSWAAAMSLMVVFALQEWLRWWLALPYQPVALSLAAVVAVALGGIRRLRALIRQLRALKLGRDGERAVGQELEKLRAAGHEIVHDVAAEGFNVDHVVIGPHGIYTVETKTLSRPARGRAELACSDDAILLNGRPMQRNPVPQCKAQAAWLRSLLEESTGRRFEVRPVVVFPGWFVPPECKNRSGVWVLNPRALPEFIRNEPAALTAQQVRSAAYHVRTYCRMAG